MARSEQAVTRQEFDMVKDDVQGLTHHVAALYEAVTQVRDEMATKADLAAGLAAVRAEMATKADLAALRAEMATKTELAAFRKIVEDGQAAIISAILRLAPR